MKPTNHKELASMFGLKDTHIISLIKNLDIPYRYIGRLYIVDEVLFIEKFFNSDDMKKGSTNKRPKTLKVKK